VVDGLVAEWTVRPSYEVLGTDSCSLLARTSTPVGPPPARKG